MPKRSRTSRFADQRIEVAPRTAHESVLHEERTLRESALLKELGPPHGIAFMRKHGLHPDEEVTNDAVAAAEIRASGWRVRWVLAEQEGSYVARSLVLEPLEKSTPPGGISTNLLRELSPTAAAIAVNEGSSTAPAWLPHILDWNKRQASRLAPHSEEDFPGRGRPPVAESELASVAELYLAELGHGPGVTRRMAMQLDMPESTVRDRIRMSREREFLSPTKQGRRGGSAGPRLVELRRQRQATSGESDS